MNIFERLDGLARNAGLSYLVIGGYAVNAHGYSRLTNDLDMLISRDQATPWKDSLGGAGFVIDHDGGNFLQLASQESHAPLLDIMLVSEETFSKMKDASGVAQVGDLRFPVPSLDHLLGLKLHALKHGPPHRGFKDFMDVLYLVEVNGIDPRSEHFRVLCEKYGNERIYEQIIGFGER